MAVTVARIVLAPREKHVLEGLADGGTLAEVALGLGIRPGTASDYLRTAKRKLRGADEDATALAIAYATLALDPPEPLELGELYIPRQQRDLVPLAVAGMRAADMAVELRRPVDVVRRDVRGLTANLRARSPAHLVKRAWQYRLVTAEQVLAWLR
ncbi:regulatory protein LuxR [Actinobacteria bacterium OK074]|nr:regulatory protein LuxR [Actinobacteria bacterium OK074]